MNREEMMIIAAKEVIKAKKEEAYNTHMELRKRSAILTEITLWIIGFIILGLLIRL